MVGYICSHQQEVFKESVRLFPPGFTKTDEYEEADTNNLTSLVDDLASKIIDIRQKLVELQADAYTNSEVTLANNANLSALKSSLENLKINMLEFNEEFNSNLKRDLGKLAQNEIQTEMGLQVEKAIKEKH